MIKLIKRLNIKSRVSSIAVLITISLGNIKMNLKAFIKSIISTLAFMFISKATPINGMFLLFVIIPLYFAYKKIKSDSSVYTKLGAAVFGVFSVLHIFQVNVLDSVLGEYNQITKIAVIIIIFLGTYLFTNTILSLLYRYFDSHKNKGESKINPNVLFAISFVLLIIIYSIVWLMFYPGTISPDTIDQIGQIVNGVYRNHHPFAHTMWIKLLMSFGNDINTRVGIANLLQLVINALVFSLVLRTIYIKTRKLSYVLLVFAFYSLMSYHSFFSIILIKDVTHATISCVLLLLLIYYFDAKEERRIVYLILIGLFSIAFCLFRSNGYYAFVVLLLFSIIYTFKKRDYLLIDIFVLAFIVSTIIKGPIYSSLGISKASPVESLSVPIQQIALTVRNGRTLTEEEKGMLNKIVDLSKVGKSYDVFLSDPIKNLVNERGNLAYLKDNTFDYFSLWLGIGLRNPVDYIQGWVNQFSTYFSPHYYSTSIFYGVWDNNLGIVGHSLLIPNNIRETLLELAYNQHNIPVLGWLHYPSITTWIMIIMFFYGLRNKDDETTLLISTLIGIFLTLMISCPYNLSFRYMYAVVCCLPLMLYGALRKKYN